MVSIIILNYNGRRFLKACIESVLAQSYADFELIIFDNNSEDNSLEFIRKNYNDSRIKLIESEKNLGFAGGNNEALKHTSNDTVVLLNNDTVVAENWLKYLVEAVKEGNTVASSFVITEGINREYYKTNGSVSFAMYNVMNIFPNIEDEFYPNGCSLIFRKSEIGEPFDSDYFFYSEDMYLGLKARFMGLKIRFVNESRVHHYGGGSTGKSMKKSFYQSRNQMLNLYSFFSAKFILKTFPVVITANTFRTFASVFSGNHSFFGMYIVPFWMLFHLGFLKQKIKKNRQFKKLPEEEIIKYMSSMLINGNGVFSRLINGISYSYSRLVGIKPIEYYQKRKLPS